MSKYSKLFTALFLFVFSFVSPKLFASSGTIIFKLPDDASIKFQPVFLGLDGNKVFASKIVKLGSRSGDSNYKERLSTTKLGGSFVGENDKGEKDWLYYLGKTEVSQHQWNVVMRWWQRENGLTVESENNSQLPQTGKTPAEILTFIQALNVWMLKNDRDALPKNGNAIAYIRLPTEVEWAYAARGGNKVDQEVFDRPYPYVDENDTETLDGYEWDRDSSGNHVKEVGSQYIKPNPLGLYDMLGNVEELTYGIFGQDFLFARFGGLVIRGGNYSTDSEDLKVSLRTEYDGYTQDGNILRLKKVGFRLALGSLVSETGYTPTELDQGYDEYLSTPSGVSQSAPQGKTSMSQQAIDDQQSYSDRERERLIEENHSLNRKYLRIESKFVALQGDLEKKNNELDFTSKELKAEKIKNSNLSTLADTSSIENKFNVVMNSKDVEITRLHSELNKMKQKVNYQGVALINAEASQKQVMSLQQKVSDAKRRDNTANFEIEKNKKRIIIADQRLLEALTRVADYNLFSAWRNLEIIEKKRKVSNNPNIWRVNEIEAKNMLIEYRRYVIQIVDETDYTLFPEVKANLVRWLKDNNVSNQQIKGLDLLERHINEVRNGKYLEVNDLYKNLLNEPEMRG
ncbi:SUMF1/EgtB/PvdO family nonheme iron enzyme [Photobacterium toruni]|uniref:SUMF1/EgtB/PvdO family nonheme iron enzyme n=1 Tax=Photobacterium toruni TaxID=1935446 RepID=UPI002E18C660|nr:SUMF1/EgtB/PvdO family nonheme iron enzyme [Photobacterium toruni]